MKGISPSSSPESNGCSKPVRDTLIEELEECLTNVQSDGSFAMFEALNNAPNPGLYLKSSGVVGLPLSDNDAQAIISASHEAPFGKGEETIVDTSVRKTWEISLGEFELRNPAWQPFIESIVAKVSAGLGVDAAGKGVAGKLYKLLLYEEGAMFKPHKDSEKAPRMFATLVVALPSKHEGGEVRITHAGKTEIFETSEFSEFDFSYLAWFANVTHEVKPVLSGRRLVLTYNLVHTTLALKELAANSDRGMAKLRLLFSRWKCNIEEGLSLPATLAFLFEHQYTNYSLCYNGLKGHDRQVAAHLREVCIEYGFCFYLANLERSISGGCDEYDGCGYGYGRSAGFHDLIEEYDKQISLKRIVELDGSGVARDLEFKEELFIQHEPFKGAEPDDEDYSGYTGNEGVSATHFYRRTVAILVPRSHRIEFFLSPSATKKGEYANCRPEMTSENPKVIDWLDRLTEELSRTPNDATAREDLEQICKMVIRYTKAWKALPPPAQSWRRKPAPFSDEVIMRILITAVSLDNKAIFVDAYHLCSGKAFPSIFRPVGTALLRYNLESLLPALSSQLAAMNDFADRFNITEELRAGLDTEARLTSRNPAVYLDWIKSEVNQAVSSLAMTSAKDGTILANLSKQLPSQEVFNKILPVVKRNVNYTPMAMAFLAELFDAGVSGEIPESVTHTIFKDVISDLADQFSLQSLDQAPKVSKRLMTVGSWETRHFSQTRTVAAPDYDNSKNIATLLCHSLSLGLETELDQIITKLVSEVAKAPVNLFEVIYLPFLKALIDKLREKSLSTQDSPFQRLFQMTLGTYVIQYVQPEPVPPKDWTRPSVSCRCSDCQALNAFLRAPDRQVGRFAVNKQRRAHLHQRIDSSGMTHETERRGSPQTLVVTKNLAQHHAAHKAWAQRCNVARNHIQNLGMEAVKEFLSEMYGPVMSLSANKLLPSVKALQSSSPLSPSTSNENASNRVLPPITKRKVPAEIIVLDD